MDSLLRCPFCGGEARLTYSTDNHRQPYVTCDTPKCPGCNPYQWHFRTETEAIESWNRRAETTTEMLMRVLAYDATCGVCDKQKERTAKVQELPRRRETSLDWEGICSNCGAYTNHDMNYCFECGVRLDWSE